MMVKDELILRNCKVSGLLVDRIIASHWRPRRLGRVEAGIFAWERYEELAERAEREAQGYESDRTSFLIRAANITIIDEKGHEEALSRSAE
jgi:hypothetical protein